MDKVDRQLVRLLQKDGRLTNQSLAERINLSPSPCLRRTRLLEERGVIEGYTAIVNQEKYGLPICAFVSVRLEKQNDITIAGFEKGVQQLEEVMECYLMTGSRDYLLRVVARSLKDYERFVREKLTKIPGIGSLDSSFAYGNVKKSYTLPQV